MTALPRSMRITTQGHDLTHSSQPMQPLILLIVMSKSFGSMVSTHIEQFLVEIGGAQPVGHKIAAQGCAKGGRSAEPDTGVRPVRHHLAQARAGQQAVFGIAHQMQCRPCRCRVSLKQGLGLRGDFRHAMDQVDLFAIRCCGKVFEPGNEGGDPDPCANPDLARLVIVKSKAAIRPLYSCCIAHCQRFGQAVRIVAQC